METDQYSDRTTESDSTQSTFPTANEGPTSLPATTTTETAPVSRRQRRSSAGPTFDATPYSSVDYTDRKTGKGQDHFVETLSRHSRNNPKFRIRREVTSVALRNLDQCESPEELLAGAFARCIRDVYAKYDDVVKYGVTVDSPHLDYPIEVPYRAKWQNSPGALLNEFNRVAQSKQASNLYGAPVKITVTALCGRSGGSRTKGTINHNVNEKSLIKVVNPDDGYCMLYALELSRIHSTVNKPGGLSSDQFRKVLRRGTRKRSRGPQTDVPTMVELVEGLFR
ncbi:hypothetical protein AAVH_28408, partial [Aphelenchoides avenae]